MNCLFSTGTKTTKKKYNRLNLKVIKFTHLGHVVTFLSQLVCQVLTTNFCGELLAQADIHISKSRVLREKSDGQK